MKANAKVFIWAELLFLAVRAALALPILIVTISVFISACIFLCCVKKKKKKKKAHTVSFMQPLFLNEWTETARVQ